MSNIFCSCGKPKVPTAKNHIGWYEGILSLHNCECGSTYSIKKTMPQPDCDICSDCKEHTDFDYTEDEGHTSTCCGAAPYAIDGYEINEDR